MIRLDNYRAHGFDRGASRGKEVLWVAFKWCFLQSALPWPSALRVTLLRWFGAKVGHGVVIRSQVNITFPWRVEIGDHVWIGDEVLMLSLAKVVVQSHSCISQRAFLCTGSHDFGSPGFDLRVQPITIGTGCWVGAQAFVGPGVVFGDGSRCLAGAVVVKPVAAGRSVGGVPAREIAPGGSGR